MTKDLLGAIIVPMVGVMIHSVEGDRAPLQFVVEEPGSRSEPTPLFSIFFARKRTICRLKHDN